AGERRRHGPRQRRGAVPVPRAQRPAIRPRYSARVGARRESTPRAFEHGRRGPEIAGARLAREVVFLERQPILARHVVKEIAFAGERVDRFLVCHWFMSAVRQRKIVREIVVWRGGTVLADSSDRCSARGRRRPWRDPRRTAIG